MVEFKVDFEAIEEQPDTKLFFGSAEKLRRGVYKSVGNSRCVALVTTAETLEGAHNLAAKAASYIKGLDSRADVGSTEYMHRLATKHNRKLT